LFDDPKAFDQWVDKYVRRLAAEDKSDIARSAAMEKVNPAYIPRNHLVEAALKAAASGDMAPFDKLLSMLTAPFDAREGAQDYASPAPETFGKHVTFCGT
jgi:uncharacterized protein YdiU (UPF0061 family)